MRQYKTRVRKMRQPGRHHGRSTDGIRQTYHDPDVRAARIARDRDLQLRGRRPNAA